VASLAGGVENSGFINRVFVGYLTHSERISVNLEVAYQFSELISDLLMIMNLYCSPQNYRL
jgi:hypothetical protein